MATVKGLKRLQDKLKRLGPEARKQIGEASLKSMAELAAEMRRLAPVDDGALRDSVKMHPGMIRDRAGKLVAAPMNETAAAVTAGNKEAFHAIFVEFGTAPHENKGRFVGTQHPGTPAQPFFYPAWRANERRIKSRVRRALNKSLKSV